MQIVVKDGGFLDRGLSRLGLTRSSQIKASSSYAGASYNRLLQDWGTANLSAYHEIRGSLYTLRARSRELTRNNPHAHRFINAARQNVIGPSGLTLEVALDPAIPNAEKIGEAIELAWSRWSRRVTTDGRLSFIDASNLWLESLLKDGEVFVRKVRGYPHNEFGFAIEFIDPDRVDWTLDRPRSVAGDGTVTNQIRMGVELDDWYRSVAYHVLATHPTDMGPRQHVRIPAAEIDHSYVFRRPQQTRGVPFLQASMWALHMLGELEGAELIASRLEASKMGFFTSKTGDEYAGKRDKNNGPITMEVTPGHFEQLPEGVDFKEWNANHPNTAFPEFDRALLRSIAVGGGSSYATISGDLRDVNFSSLRQGILDERDGWGVLQTLADEHWCSPLIPDWLSMALLSGQLRIPAAPELVQRYLDGIGITGRGFEWVDPLKDGSADVQAIRAGLKTLKSVCAKQGVDWRDNILQREKEIAFAKEHNVVIDLGGAGERAPETAGEGDVPPASAPAKSAPAQPPQRKNGLAINPDFSGTISTLAIDRGPSTVDQEVM